MDVTETKSGMVVHVRGAVVYLKGNFPAGSARLPTNLVSEAPDRNQLSRQGAWAKWYRVSIPSPMTGTTSTSRSSETRRVDSVVEGCWKTTHR
jgi:hypothetical protein